MGVVGDVVFDGEAADVGEGHGGVAVESSVFGRDFACAVGESPWWVCEDGCEPAVGVGEWGDVVVGAEWRCLPATWRVWGHDGGRGQLMPVLAWQLYPWGLMWRYCWWLASA